MRRRLWLLLALVLAPVPEIASAQQPAATPHMFFSRVFSQSIVYALPEGWKLLGEGPSADGSRYTLNFGRIGVPVESWTETITVTGFKDLMKDPKASPAGMIEHLSRQKRSICPERAVAISGGNVMFGARRGAAAMIGCGRLPADMAGMKAGEGEISLHIVVAGTSDMYVLTRLQRVAAYEPKSPPVTDEIFGQLVRGFLPIGVCELKDSLAQCQPKLGGQR
jgi:hypothetical protein